MIRPSSWRDPAAWRNAALGILTETLYVVALVAAALVVTLAVRILAR